jgi:serine/threonine protein kinase
MKTDFKTAYADCPIVCKLADFGLSRSLQIQTKTVLMSKMQCIGHGTLKYMAPEIHLPKPSSVDQDDLKKSDIWSLGIVMHQMVNPNVFGPYHNELEYAGL